MRIALSASLLVLAIAGLGAAPAPAQDTMIVLTPEQIGEIFCISRMGNDMAPVEGLKSQTLRIAIEEAEQKNAVWEEANPGDKPPLGDGIPWQSYPDFAPVCTVTEVVYEMDRANVTVNYLFAVKPVVDFADHLELVLEEQSLGDLRWRIDNVSYATDGDLRSTLLAIFENY
jgi:hypothetical protein